MKIGTNNIYNNHAVQNIIVINEKVMIIFAFSKKSVEFTK